MIGIGEEISGALGSDAWEIATVTATPGSLMNPVIRVMEGLRLKEILSEIGSTAG